MSVDRLRGRAATAQAGDDEGVFHRDSCAREVELLPSDDGNGGGVREVDTVGGRGSGGPTLDPSVGPFFDHTSGLFPDEWKTSGKDLGEKARPIPFCIHHVVDAAFLKTAGGLALGVGRVRGDNGSTIA
ncbi:MULTISPECIES: hypothetical protein [unclassified Frankia]|uniref:hypothetical protein n=1 Tax=unclassified Frankia TaxID=2632575 RepID=UPI002AD4F5F0|nr:MULTISPECIES: hypothetical protein [unclassified Frankia]